MTPAPRLQQLPFFLAPDLERTVAALPAALRDVARGLRLHLVADGRTWLEVVDAAVAAENCGVVLQGHEVTLEQLLGHGRHKGETAARHRAWHDVYNGMAVKSFPVVAKVFGGAHHTTILSGVKKHAQRLAGELAAAEAVTQYTAQQTAPANGTTRDLARTG